MPIAGHTFDTSLDPICTCGIAWTDIRETQPDQIGKPGIAHSGCLNQAEYDSIANERDRREKVLDRVWAITQNISSP